MIPFSWLVIIGTVAVAALLLLAIVLALTGPSYPSDHDGPWGMGAVLMLGLSMAPQFPAGPTSGSVAPRERVSAQGDSPCLLSVLGAAAADSPSDARQERRILPSP